VTIAVGFRCSDGVLLCADSQITYGSRKVYQAKIFKIQDGEYLTYTGDTLLAKELVAALKEATKGITGAAAAKTARQVYTAFHREHYTAAPKAEKAHAEILCSVREGRSVNLFYGKGRHWVPIETYCALGIGEEHGEALFQILYDPAVTTTQMGYSAIYALRRIKGLVEGCGGPTQLRVILDDPDVIPKPQWLAKTTLERIESDFDFFDKAIQPLIWSFADHAVDRQSFQATLAATTKRLKRRHATMLRKKEPIRMGTWLLEESSNPPSALPT
jgi:hypothetical protein